MSNDKEAQNKNQPIQKEATQPNIINTMKSSDELYECINYYIHEQEINNQLKNNEDVRR